MEVWKREEFEGEEGVWRANRDGIMGEKVEDVKAAEASDDVKTTEASDDVKTAEGPDDVKTAEGPANPAGAFEAFMAKAGGLQAKGVDKGFR